MNRDPGLYDYLPYDNRRPKISWPNGARVAFWLAPNIEFYELDPPRNPTRGAWPRPAPDVLGYSYRDYGNRTGFWRMLLLNAINRIDLQVLLAKHGLELRLIAPNETIPGSYWGEREAGVLGSRIYARLDTPLHSVLHEGAHYICMTPQRRAALLRDAGGDDAEEGAVCYLQVLMADALGATVRQQLYDDMNSWGYSFRLGCARTWFEQDAADERAWLLERALIDDRQRLTGALRG